MITKLSELEAKAENLKVTNMILEDKHKNVSHELTLATQIIEDLEKDAKNSPATHMDTQTSLLLKGNLLS